MTEAIFQRSLRQTLPILEELEVLRHPMHFPRPPSDDFKKVSFSPKSSYSDVFLTGLRNRDYSFLLTDLSYLHFFHARNRDDWSVRYGFYPNPFPLLEFDEFLEEYDVSGSDPNAIESYQQLMSEQTPRDGIGPLRYEVDFEGHRPLRHPCAHLHTAHNSPMRLPVERVLSPKAFVMFIVKHHFPDAWTTRDAAGIPNLFDDRMREERGACEVLPEPHFGPVERTEFFLT